MNDDEWPPAGHRFSWRVDIETDAGSLSFDMTLPAGTNFDLSAIRVGRHGGPTGADRAFREQLFQVIGSITAAGGHIEAAMKRLLLTVEQHDSSKFALVDLQWGDLVKRLAKLCDDSDQTRRDLKAVLDWAQ